MEVKKIVEGMTAVEVAEVIDSNFKNQNKILEEDIAKQNSVIGVSEYKDFSEAEAVNVGDVRKYNGFLYECVEATTGAFDASKWKKSSFKSETEKKLYESVSRVGVDKNFLNPKESILMSAIGSDGNIQTSEQYMRNGTVLVYDIEPNQELHIAYFVPSFTKVYASIALYKDNTLLKIVSNCSGTTEERKELVENNVDANVLKICSHASYVNVAVVYTDAFTKEESETLVNGNNILNDTIPLKAINNKAILSTSGYYKVLDATSIDVNSGIFADTGLVGTDDTYFKSGRVAHYAIQPNRIYKVHFYVPGFTKVFIDGAIYKNGSPIVKLNLLNSKNEYRDYVINTTGIDCDELLICENAIAANVEIAIISESANIPSFENSAYGKDISVLYEPCNGLNVYAIAQEPFKFGVSQRIYIEGCAKNDNGKILMLSDSQNLVVETNQSNGNEGNHEFAFKVSAEGYSSINDKIMIHTKSASNAQGKNVKIMCIGDSLTDGGYPALVEWIFNALNQDYGGNIRATMIGTKSEKGDISLGKYAFAVRGYNEGRSGAAISDYLRHFTTVTSTKEHWDMLGLGTMTRNGVKSRDYVPYEATSEQKELMRTTCHGWYDVEPTEEVWTWMKTKNWSEFFKNPFEYRGQTFQLAETYSGTSADAIIAGMKLIFENKTGTWLPLPFYDYDTMVASNGQYAFSMNAYLDKYRTLEEDGVTRLTKGGTAVGLIDDYDVCTPTHVALIMSENDARWSASADMVVADLIKFADLISIYDSRIMISIGVNRAYGAFNPQKYNDIGFVGDFLLVPRRLEAWQRLKSAIASTNYDLLPLYPMQSPIGAGGGRSFDTLSQKETLSWLGDLTHTLEDATSYLDRAYMVAAWVINTL